MAKIFLFFVCRRQGSAMMLPKWWNGRHEGLKIPWPQGCAGSSPAFGTVNKEISSPFGLEISYIYTCHPFTPNLLAPNPNDRLGLKRTDRRVWHQSCL